MPGPQGVTFQVYVPQRLAGAATAVPTGPENANARHESAGIQPVGGVRALDVRDRRRGVFSPGRAPRTGLPTLRPPHLLAWGTVAVDEAWTTPPSAVARSDGVDRDDRGRCRARCPRPIHGRGPQSQERRWVGGGQRAGLARISHQAACRRQEAHGFQEVDRDVDDRADCGLRWPRPPALRAGDPRGSFGPVRARAPSTVVPAMLSVASTRTGPKSSAIITAPGEKCGLARAHA